ncbi:alpha-L-fucosidase C-terminal domain-containing protein [uncultured Parabacteroides sp.]
MLGCDKEIQWKQEGRDLLVTMPVFAFDELPCHYTWTLKLERVK